MTHRHIRWISLFAGLACLVLALGPIWPGTPVGAQSLDGWTAAYRPAIQTQFAGDMAAYASAPRYTIDLALSVTPDEAAITGHQTVRYTNRTVAPLDSIVFRLYPNLPSYGASMQVSHVTVDDVSVTPDLDDTGTILSVPLTNSLAPGAQTTLGMDFDITVQEGKVRLYAQFSYVDGVIALPNAYPVLSIYEPGQGWWEVTDHPQGDAVYSETAFYTVSVTAPTDLILAASGSEVAMTANDDDTLTHQYVAPLMRDFALMASRDYVTLTGDQDGVTIHVTYNPNLAQAKPNARAGLQIAQDAVRIYDATFGRYPFSELDVVQTPTLAGGIEYPGLVVIAESAWDMTEDYFEFVITHEIAHQWWYSLIGNDQTQNPWIDESLAQYSVAVYIRNQEGTDAYQAALGSFQNTLESYLKSHPDNVIGLPVVDYQGNNAYFYMVYQKGPLFYAALDQAYGYDTVIAMLDDLFATYEYQIVGPDDMLSSFEATAGADLTPLFEEWIGTFPVG